MPALLKLLDKKSPIQGFSTATAVAGSEAGDANQAPNRARLHRIDQDTSGDGKQARSAEDQLRVGETPSV